MSAFAVIMLGGTAGLFVAFYLLGRAYPGSGAEVIDWHPTRSPEAEAQNELDELDQLLEVANRRRRRRGEPEVTEESMRAIVDAEMAAHASRHEDEAARGQDEEMRQVLEVKNARRRAKGLDEISFEDFKARMTGDDA